MKTFLFLLVLLSVVVLALPNAVAYDKNTQACMFVCMMRNDPQACTKERSVPRCYSCVNEQTARIKACFKSECKLDEAEAAYESTLDPRSVCKWIS